MAFSFNMHSKNENAQSLLELKNIEISYQESRSSRVFSIVELDNLQLKKGETLGLVGESGSGKTMTALSIMSLLPKGISVSKGSIIFDGEDIADLDENQIRKVRGGKIGMVFQEPSAALDPLFPIGAQLKEAIHDDYIPTVRDGHPKEEKSVKALRLLSEVGLPNPQRIMRAFPHELSGGMKQRVMVAISIANDPKLLIADEPTTALDVTLQKQILDLVKKLIQTRSLSLLLISHDLNVVRYVCDRIAIMYAGKIVEFANTDEIFKNPRHPYTQLLLSSMLSDESIDRRQELLHIKGEVPDLHHFPTGCRFNPRCPKAMEVCKRIEPRLQELTNDVDDRTTHSVSCHLY